LLKIVPVTTDNQVKWQSLMSQGMKLVCDAYTFSFHFLHNCHISKISLMLLISFRICNDFIYICTVLFYNYYTELNWAV